MTQEYFEFRGKDYIPFYGAVRGRKRFEEMAKENSELRVRASNYLGWVSVHLLSTLGTIMAVSQLERLAK